MVWHLNYFAHAVRSYGEIFDLDGRLRHHTPMRANRVQNQLRIIGGQWRAIENPDALPPYRHDRHEHSYHMYLNWYNNFWKLTFDLGLAGNFEPRTTFKYLRRGQFPHMSDLTNNGAPATLAH